MARYQSILEIIGGMMKSILMLVLFAAGTVAQASDEDFYQTANASYNASAMVSPFRFLGWYSGRCASASNPTVKYAALLTSYVGTGGVMKSAFWTEPGKPETYYDHMTSTMIREIQDSLAQYDADIPPLLPHGDHWRATHIGDHADETHTRANDAAIAVQAFHDGVQTAACLFTSKVRSN
ncbi:MAG: hypothetical protein JST80_06265 [Bdellovibrionales bacterium]|nr:hypothetical protein [Bdellovibrionales bacterium]